VRAVATGYVELFRNLPLILVVFWAFYVVPIMLGVGLSPLATGLAALALNVTAYNAETFRAGINSIRRGQTEAAVALGNEPRAGASARRDPPGGAAHPAGYREHVGIVVQGTRRSCR
jgi:ABC-type amino acid transport system permease subunit